MRARVLRLLSAFLTAVLVAGWGAAGDRADVLTFSHQLHVLDVEAECEDCHVDVAVSRLATDRLLPTHDECEACHDVEDEEECSMCHAGPEPRAFPIAERLIRFDHGLHVTERELECTVCHAGIEETEDTRTVFLPPMETCSGCHDDTVAPRNCAVCHLDVTDLRPMSHRLVDWIQEHAREMRIGGQDARCAACHTDDDCRLCHDSPELAAVGVGAPRTLPELRVDPDDSSALVLDRVHELNYLFTHPLDARGQVRDCDTCHDPQDFCAACHQGTQDGGFPPPFPPDHDGPGFVTVGVGTGGGRHAELARRDIESCAACHDESGADPVCITCHEDRTPGLGNDPRTHAADFDDRHGDWHSDAGSICFHCHTDSGMAGLGFCGYCHGAEGG